MNSDDPLLPFLLIACIIGAIIYIRSVLKPGDMLPVECEEAIAILIEAGCAVELNSFHIYKSKAHSEYTILNFDNKGNIKSDQEESFTDINDAVSKFVRRTKL